MQFIYDTNPHVKEIVNAELKKTEDQYNLPDHERLSEDSRYQLIADPFTVGVETASELDLN